MSNETPTPPPPRGRLTVLLANAPGSVFALFVIFASFSTYFCMYAFRKPFSAAGYDGLVFLDSTIDLNSVVNPAFYVNKSRRSSTMAIRQEIVVRTEVE